MENKGNNYAPMSPQLGPPLPQILKCYWPGVKPPAELVPSPPPPPAPAPSAPAPRIRVRASNYVGDTTIEERTKMEPLRISPSWLQFEAQRRIDGE